MCGPNSGSVPSPRRLQSAGESEPLVYRPDEAGRSEQCAPLGGAAHSARRFGRRGPLRAPDLPPPGWPRGMQLAGGGAPRPGRGDGFPGCLRQLDPAVRLMLLADADRPEPMRSGARELALFLTPEPGAEVGDGGWRCGRQVLMWGDWGPRALGEKCTGAGRPARGYPDPNSRLLRSILSHAAQGLRARRRGARAPFFCEAVTSWRCPEMRGRSRPLSLPADPAPSPSPPATPTPHPWDPLGSLPLRPPSSGRDIGPRPLGAAAPPGADDPCQALGSSAQRWSPGAGRRRAGCLCARGRSGLGPVCC